MQAKANIRKGDRPLKLQPAKRKHLGSTGFTLKQEKRQRLLESIPTALPGGDDDEDDFALTLEDRDPETDGAQPERIEQNNTASRPISTTLSASTENSREQVTPEQAAAKAERRKRDRERRKVKKLSAKNWEQAKTMTSGIANASLEQQAQWLWESYAGATGASFLERGGLEESCIASLGSQGSFEEQLVGVEEGWAEQLANPLHSEHGSPVVILVASSAMGANNLAKQLPALNKRCRLGKLFAKHFKVEEQQRELDSRCINIATGTPHRMCKLADEGSLRFDRFKLLVLDAALDAKQRSILDIPEVRGDLWLFFKRHIKSLLASGQAKLALIDSSSF